MPIMPMANWRIKVGRSVLTQINSSWMQLAMPLPSQAKLSGSRDALQLRLQSFFAEDRWVFVCPQQEGQWCKASQALPGSKKPSLMMFDGKHHEQTHVFHIARFSSLLSVRFLTLLEAFMQRMQRYMHRQTARIFRVQVGWLSPWASWHFDDHSAFQPRIAKPKLGWVALDCFGTSGESSSLAISSIWKICPKWMQTPYSASTTSCSCHLTRSWKNLPRYPVRISVKASSSPSNGMLLYGSWKTPRAQGLRTLKALKALIIFYHQIVKDSGRPPSHLPPTS